MKNSDGKEYAVVFDIDGVITDWYKSTEPLIKKFCNRKGLRYRGYYDDTHYSGYHKIFGTPVTMNTEIRSSVDNHYNVIV